MYWNSSGVMIEIIVDTDIGIANEHITNKNITSNRYRVDFIMMLGLYILIYPTF
jgi:hypothetical protein